MKIISYDERVAKMQKPGDEDEQLRLAKQYMQNLKRKMKKATTLDEKVEINTAVREAEAVLRKLRLNIFNLEDMLKARVQAQ